MSTPLTIDTNLEEIVENFSYLDDWEDRYGYLIELGNALTPLPENELIDSNKVNGCASQVWLTSEKQGDVIHFLGASDAHIVRGLVAVALSIFSGKSADEIANIDAQDTFSAIGLSEHISSQRANGLKSMVRRIKAVAQESTV